MARAGPMLFRLLVLCIFFLLLGFRDKGVSLVYLLTRSTGRLGTQ